MVGQLNNWMQGGAGSEVWNRVYMIARLSPAPVKKFGRVRLSTIFLQNKMQTWRDDEFLLGFEFSSTF